MTKQCKKCLETKCISLFPIDVEYKDNHRNKCKVCQNIDNLKHHANWRIKNPEKLKIKNQIQSIKNSKMKYSKRNPDKICALSAKRRASKLERTPKWLTSSDFIAIQNFYILAKEKTISTGVKHDVDHIIPLQGRTVSGLHVPWNLQVITSSENKTKHNKLELGE